MTLSSYSRSFKVILDQTRFTCHLV